MADISYSLTMKVDKGFLSNTVNVSGITASMSATGMRSDTYSLSSTPVNISTANLSSVGMAFVRNLSTSTGATCAFGVEVAGSFLAIAAPRPGEAAIMRLASGVAYQATGTAGSRLRVDITEG